MQIFVKNLAGKTLTLDVDSSDSVDTIKRQVEAREGIPCSEQRLVYCGRQLDDDTRALSDYNMQREGTLHLMLSLLGGGNSSSSSISETISACTTNIVNAMSSTTDSASSGALSNQTMTITFEAGSYTNCGSGALNVSQTAQITSDLTATFSTSNSTNLSSAITNAISAAASSSQSQVSGFLGTQIGDSQSSNTTISESIKTFVETNITDIIKNSCSASVANNQTGVYSFYGTLISPGGCNFGQHVQLTLAVSCLMTSVVSSIASDAVLNKACVAAAATQDQTSTGPIQDVFNGIANVLGSLTYPILIAAVCIVVAIIIYILFKAFSGGSKTDKSKSTESSK